MEILKQPLIPGVSLPTGKTRCHESRNMAEGCRDAAEGCRDTAEGCRDRHVPGSNKRLCSAPVFQHLLDGQQSPTHGQTLAEELQETRGDGWQRPEGKERSGTAKQSTTSASTGFSLCLARVRQPEPVPAGPAVIGWPWEPRASSLAKTASRMHRIPREPRFIRSTKVAWDTHLVWGSF